MAQANDETAIHALIEERVRAVRTKDLEALLAHYAADVTTFDLVLPLQNGGVDSLRRRLTEWFGSFTTEIGYELRDLRLQCSGDVAFDTHLTHVQGTNRTGQHIDMWFRETVGYRKQGGRWVVVHQHSSVPFDMTNGQVRLDLKP